MMYQIVDLYWERANLIIVFNKAIKDKKIYLEDDKNNKITLDVEDNKLRLSIYNIPKLVFLPKGKYILKNKELIIKPTNEVIKKFDDNTRVFNYDKGRVCTIKLGINEECELFILNNFYKENKRYKKSDDFFAIPGKKNKIIYLYKKVKKEVLKLIFNTINLLCRKKYILFLTENFDEFMGNLKYMYEYMEDKEKDIIRTFAVDRFKKPRKQLLKELFLIASSKVIVIDNRTPLFGKINLKKNQKLVQLWHAGCGFKAIGYARFGLPGSPILYESNHRKYDLVIVDSEELVDIYMEVFGVPREKVLACGMPRLNNYLDKDIIDSKIKKLYEKEQILIDKKIILFSPTYRGPGHIEAFYDYDKIDLEKINKFCEDNDFLFVIKMHPFVREKIKIDNAYKNIIDMSDEDINELIYISDIMISDYSSCVYEFSLFNRPIIYYRYDKDLYEYERPVHTIEKFISRENEVYTFDELLEKLDQYKNISIKDRFKNITAENNNSSSKTIYKKIMEMYNKK